MSDLGQSEYQALRATIRERGTARVCLVLAGVGLWAILVATGRTIGLPGGAGLVPLAVLAAAFEINFFIHTGVERIGRYIQVFYEESSGATGWETTAMNYGAKFPGGADPLFAIVFSICGVANFLATSVLAPYWPASTALAVIAHLAFAYRIVTARKLAAGQRAVDLDRFRALNSK